MKSYNSPNPTSKILVRLLPLMVSLFCFTSITFGQSTEKTQTAEQKTTTIVDSMKVIATLTADQVAQVTPLVLNFMKQKEADDIKYANDPDGLKNAREANRKELLNNLKAILPHDQFEKISNRWLSRLKAGKTTSTK